MIPYKNRKVDPDRFVKVYRNLHKDGYTYSVKQNGLVVAHTQELWMRDVLFYVNPTMYEKFLNTWVRQIFAYVKGYICDPPENIDYHSEISFNPKKHSYFYDVNTDKPAIEGNKYLHINKNQLTLWNSLMKS
jgi:hypothetical protein